MMTTVQDGGRVGFQQYGMPVAGPMDGESYAIGQALVGNTTPVGALECTVLSPTLKVKDTCIVAFTGADMRLSSATILENQIIYLIRFYLIGAAVNATNRYALYWARKLRTLQKRVSVILAVNSIH